MSFTPGTFIGGKYLVRRALAAGGMGEVFLCEALGRSGFAKTVVVKCMHPHVAKDPTLVQMFKAEARLAARFTHPNIVQTFAFDAHGDTYYLAMEYVNGHSLKEVLTRASEKASLSLRPILAAHIAAQVAAGLHHAHSARDNDGTPLKVVHRDVTPHNVMLSRDGDVKLTDFGIAKVNAHTPMTAAGMLKGKLAYMSPEQAEGEKVDARTDVFALGITLWEMLTGCRLFEGKTDQQLIFAVLRARIRPPSSMYSQIPPELDAIVLRALERDLTQRFQTARELEQSLTQFILSQSHSLEDVSVQRLVTELFPAPPESTGHEARTVKALPDPSNFPIEEPKPAHKPVLEPTHLVTRTESISTTAPTEPDTDPRRRAPPAAFPVVRAAALAVILIAAVTAAAWFAIPFAKAGFLAIDPAPVLLDGGVR